MPKVSFDLKDFHERNITNRFLDLYCTPMRSLFDLKLSDSNYQPNMPGLGSVWDQWDQFEVSLGMFGIGVGPFFN